MAASARQHRKQLLLHHHLHVSEAKPISDGKNGTPLPSSLVPYRQPGKYLLHEFVVMPDHFQLLITPAMTLERALQLIKGGFSYRARKELGFGGDIWQTSYYVRDCGTPTAKPGICSAKME